MSEQAKTSRDISSHDEEVVKTKMNDDVKACKGAKVTNIDARSNAGRDTSKGTGNEREARLETALRANLRKRKQQARARSEQK